MERDGDIDWYIKCSFFENGYRLPTEAEWEHSVRDGVKSKNFRYPGSNKVGEDAWYWDWYGNYTSKSKTDPVGPTSGSSRVHRGGSWNCRGGGCTPSFRDTNYPYSAESNIGFRVVRCL